jgi:hypothetical protein
VYSIAVSGNKLFVVDPVEGTIGEYTTSGATVNPTLITGLSFPNGIAVSGGNLFVVDRDTGTIGEYTTSGATPDASSTWTLLLLGLTATFGLKPSLRRPA